MTATFPGSVANADFSTRSAGDTLAGLANAMTRAAKVLPIERGLRPSKRRQGRPFCKAGTLSCRPRATTQTGRAPALPVLISALPTRPALPGSGLSVSTIPNQGKSLNNTVDNATEKGIMKDRETHNAQ